MPGGPVGFFRAGQEPEQVEALAKEGEKEVEWLRKCVDLLAERYGWSKNEVLELPTSERNWFVEQVNERYRKEAEAAKR